MFELRLFYWSKPLIYLTQIDYLNLVQANVNRKLFFPLIIQPFAVKYFWDILFDSFVSCNGLFGR